jgi:hypothetical protein
LVYALNPCNNTSLLLYSNLASHPTHTTAGTPRLTTAANQLAHARQALTHGPPTLAPGAVQRSLGPRAALDPFRCRHLQDIRDFFSVRLHSHCISIGCQLMIYLCTLRALCFYRQYLARVTLKVHLHRCKPPGAHFNTIEWCRTSKLRLRYRSQLYSIVLEIKEQLKVPVIPPLPGTCDFSTERVHCIAQPCN